MTYQEHLWLEYLYECWSDGSCRQTPEARKQGKDALRFAQRLAQNAAHLREALTEREELDILNDASGFLEKEFKCKIHVIQSYTSKSQKALRAEPGKPGIEVISSS